MASKPEIILRSVLFNIAFVLWFFFASFTGFVLALLGQKKLLSRWASVWGGGFGVPERLLLNLHYELKGRENLPPAPAILAMQHQSEWETYHFFDWFPDSVIVFKKELLNVPFLGTCLKTYGGIPVARSKKAEDLKQFLTAARKIMDEKRNIVIFPQGTRTKPGATANYNKGVAVLYGALDIPVVPITLNSGAFWGKDSFLKYPGTIQVQIHPPIPPGLPRDEVMEILKNYYEGPKSGA